MALKRRLILLLDGTWNEDEARSAETNILRLQRAIAASLTLERPPLSTLIEVNENERESEYFSAVIRGQYEYMIFYERGVGTGPGLDRLFGGAFGVGLELNIRRAYRFLSRNYKLGSEVFIFGFSRGAYTARSLIGLLSTAGLLRPEKCDAQTEALAWEYYLVRQNDRLPAVWKQLEPNIFERSEFRIACVGLFDTVGALGIPLTLFRKFNRSRHEFHDVELSPITKINLHALAIDEHREPFKASVWRMNPLKSNNSVTEQVWFAGAHSDVGGGYLKAEDRLSDTRALDDVSLDWMIKRLKHFYPDFPITNGRWWQPVTNTPIQAELHDSRSLRYKIYKYSLRAIRNTEAESSDKYKMVNCDPEAYIIGEYLHQSVLDRLGEKALIGGQERIYAPLNVIIHLDNLFGMYCGSEDEVWADQPLKIVSIEGNIVNPTSKDKACEAIASAIKKSCENLSKYQMYHKYLGAFFGTALVDDQRD